MQSKPFYMSKTLWINVLAAAAALAGAFGIDVGLTPEVQVAIVGGVMAVLNILLRLTTKTAIES